MYISQKINFVYLLWANGNTLKSKAISTVTKSLSDFFDNLYKSLVFNRYSFFLKTLK